MSVNVWGGGPKLHNLWRPANGWDKCFNFSNLANLLQQMKDNNIQPGSVDKLGIVAHGDAGGVVQLTAHYLSGAKDLTVANIRYYAKDMRGIKSYLTSSAWLIFFSCIAGRGRAGDNLIGRLSSMLPGRTIVAFTNYGYVPVSPNMPSPVQAGDIYVAGEDQSTKPADYAGKPRETVWVPTAKWAKNGYIIREPKGELDKYQRRLPDKRCGSIFCLGHAQFGDVCNPYFRHPRRDFLHVFPFRPMPIPQGAVFVPKHGGPKRTPGGQR